jgi:hypothetical protein
MDDFVYFIDIHFGPKSFILGDLILIKGQFIWIFEAKAELEEHGSKLKRHQTWVACQKFQEKHNFVL